MTTITSISAATNEIKIMRWWNLIHMQFIMLSMHHVLLFRSSGELADCWFCVRQTRLSGAALSWNEPCSVRAFLQLCSLLAPTMKNYWLTVHHVSLLWHVCQSSPRRTVQYIPRNMHRVFALLCFVVVIHWLIFPYPSGLLHWHCGNLTIAPVPAKQPWWIWINTSCEFIMNDCITTTKQSTTKPCAYFLGYTVWHVCQSSPRRTVRHAPLRSKWDCGLHPLCNRPVCTV